MGYLARFALIIGASALFAGCGGSQAPMEAPSVIRSIPEDRAASEFPHLAPGADRSTAERPGYSVSTPLLYVVDYTTNSGVGDVKVYDAKANDPSPIAVITSGLYLPNGDCIDGDGTLYVGSDPASGSGWISEYALGKTEPFATITNGIDGPAFCAIDSHGNLWVANNSGPPNVTEYLKGSTTPHATITSGLTDPVGVAIDHAGDLYVGNLEPYGTSNVQVYQAGNTTPTRTITRGVRWPVGIAVDARGTLYVTNDNQPCNVEEYREGESKPFKKITDEINGPVAITFSRHGRMYETNEGTLGCAGPWPVILEFRPGSVKPSKREISQGLHTAVGVAYYPPLLP